MSASAADSSSTPNPPTSTTDRSPSPERERSPSPLLTDYDSSSSVEIVVDKDKLQEELNKEIEEAKKNVKPGEPTYNDGCPLQIGSDGRVRSGRVVCLERIIRVRKQMKAESMKNMEKHLKRPFVRKAYDYFRRDFPMQNTLMTDTRRKVFISADDKRMTVRVEHREKPYPY